MNDDNGYTEHSLDWEFESYENTNISAMIANLHKRLRDCYERLNLLSEIIAQIADLSDMVCSLSQRVTDLERQQTLDN